MHAWVGGMDGQVDRWTGGWMGRWPRWVDWWMDGPINRWIDGWYDLIVFTQRGHIWRAAAFGVERTCGREGGLVDCAEILCHSGGLPGRIVLVELA